MPKSVGVPHASSADPVRENVVVAIEWSRRRALRLTAGDRVADRAPPCAPPLDYLRPSPRWGRGARALRCRAREDSYLVDSASSHMLVSKIKPCMSEYKQLYGETANGSLNQLSFI
ncbi:hypothetical protein BDY17DRAFT_258995 [Neohortaea acidophila]|uniref:Uncharacterized protein n=1 Tax=Neohortaea acidophila TaxID=245834 RepID=A0A6A6PES7_9PEZI|nr:hypothetical protein BDY17DRAFT_258995 [Neohortaea acidophila]